MTISKVISEIGKKIPLQQAEDFDNAGLLCGNPDREVSGILICHDSLESVIDEAIGKKVNFIIAFHPIIFSGLKSITPNNYVERSIFKAIENKIAIFAIHTAFDNYYFGVNFRICEHLGLINQKVLMPKSNNLKTLEVYVPAEFSESVREALFQANAGSIGFYDECSFSVAGKGTFRPTEGSNPFSGQKNMRENTNEHLISVIFEDFKQNAILAAMKAAHPYEEVAHRIINMENDNHHVGLGRFGHLEKEMEEQDFLQFVKEKFDLTVIRHSNYNSKKIKRVGVLGGSGSNGIKAALKAKCDAYLTGDIKYHDFFQNEGKMMICDIGHFESERLVTTQLFEILSEIFPKFAISKSVEKTNPVNYFL